ncbi:MAG: phosphate:acyl-(acyl carrier protein) acyltransferase [Frankiales bacterium]|nr:phosphate:acyl-(acyl carrier protein) acyltransferase [Frankiales bacterium]
MRVALDLLGGDHAPDAVIDGALLAVDRDPAVEVVLVGPPAVAAALLAARGRSLPVVAARESVGMDEDPARGVRAKRDATVRTIHALVRSGSCDAAVSVGPTGAVLAGAVLTLGRISSRPAVAVVVPTAAGPVVLLDAGATSETTPEQLVSHAVLGTAYAQALGTAHPRVGLLNVGTEPGKGDQLRKDAFALLERAPVRFVGNVEGHDVPRGGPADVVVTDGFTGNVLLKAIEGASTQDLPRSALLLGVDGITVVGHGASDGEDVAACVAHAARLVGEGLLERLRATLNVGAA